MANGGLEGNGTIQDVLRGGGVMEAWQYAIWGLFGGFAVEGLEFSGAIRRIGGWPWQRPNEPGPLPLIVSVLIRLAIGSGLALAAGSSGQVSGPFGALAVGVAAPLLVEQLARQIPQTTPAPISGADLATPSRPVTATSTDPSAGDIQAGRGRAN
jgi:hypothetical protein